MSECETKRGFTLIELLIVVAIIAILAAIAVPNFLEAQIRSKVSRVKADQRTIATALETYAIDHNVYPPTIRSDASYIDWDRRYDPLTTPVAHLTSLGVVKDVFHDPLDKLGLNQGLVFVYLDRDSFLRVNPPEDWIKDYFDTNPDLLMFGKKWMIWSYGPDMDSDYDTFSDIDGVDIRGVYDSTNGSKSSGDIHRMGP